MSEQNNMAYQSESQNDGDKKIAALEAFLCHVIRQHHPAFYSFELYTSSTARDFHLQHLILFICISTFF